MSPVARSLHDTLAALHRQWRWRVAAESAAMILGAALVAILAGALLAALVETPSPLTVRAVGYALVAAAAAYWLVRPLARRHDPARFALYVEERAPELGQALLAALDSTAGSSPALSARAAERALAIVAPLARGASLERPRLLRAARTTAVVAAAGALALAFGPGALRDAARVLFMPWGTAVAAVPPRAIAVEPGDLTVPRGGAVEVRATLRGFAADAAELVFRPDSAGDWVRLPMAQDSAAGDWRVRLFDLARPTEYYVEADGTRSPTFRLAISDLPAVRQVSLDLAFPPHTGLPPEHIEDGGDVAAPVGTVVTVTAAVTRPVRGAVLVLDDGRTVPLAVADGAVRGRFRVAADGFYRIDLVAPDGRTVAGGVQYAIDALADRRPTVAFDAPGRDTRATAVEEVLLAARADDDYGVVRVALQLRVNGGEERTVPLLDGARGLREARATHTLFLEEFGLRPGDVIAYHAEATDAAGQVGQSDVYFIEVRPFGRDYRQGEGGQEGGGGQQDGTASPEGFVPRQKEVISGTFNWVRDSAMTPPRRRRDDLSTLTVAQGRLREDVAQVSRRITERGVARSDSNFVVIQRQLDSAVTWMQAAEERLGQGDGRTALPLEQRALQHLQRAEAVFREVTVQRGGGGGGGGGGSAQRSAEELADLFELETDRLENQYETLQRRAQQAQGQQQEVDEALERLRQLAARQQQENERAQRAADALRERLGREAGGGSGAQRELARQAEEEARRLERLAREQQSPELESAAQRLQQAADAMRRAGSGATAQGTAALEALRRATRALEDTRQQQIQDGVRRLGERARELARQQEEIARGVMDLPRLPGQARAERTQQLSQAKDRLQAGVERLEQEADQLARQGRRDQPAAAARLGEAAETIRDQRLRDKIAYSKSVIRGGSPEYAEAFEGQIGEDLAEVGERLQAAQRALTGESAARRAERALDQARELVRGMESLRERTAAAQRARDAQPGREGQQGRQGQQRDAGRDAGGAQQGQSGARDGGPVADGSPSERAGSLDARQLAREFRARRGAAEELRRDLAAQGVDVRELDRAIRDLREIEGSLARTGDPLGKADLQAAVVEQLKTFEFALSRTLGAGAGSRPALGAGAPVPAEYRALVEEYYRALAGEGRKPRG